MEGCHLLFTMESKYMWNISSNNHSKLQILWFIFLFFQWFFFYFYISVTHLLFCLRNWIFYLTYELYLHWRQWCLLICNFSLLFFPSSHSVASVRAHSLCCFIMDVLPGRTFISSQECGEILKKTCSII